MENSTRRHSVPRKLTPFLALLILLIPSACSSGIPPAASPAPTPAIAPASTSFTDYATGSADVPVGQYLFIEYAQSETCSQECNCPDVEPPRSVYGFDGEGNLWMEPDAFGGVETLNGLLDGGLPGFYGSGRWQEKIDPITGLPFSAPSYDVMQILSIRPDGSAVVSTGGTVMLLAARETWSNSSLSMWESPPGCMKQYDTRVTNHGFISRGQIRTYPN